MEYNTTYNIHIRHKYKNHIVFLQKTTKQHSCFSADHSLTTFFMCSFIYTEDIYGWTKRGIPKNQLYNADGVKICTEISTPEQSRESI